MMTLSRLFGGLLSLSLMATTAYAAPPTRIVEGWYAHNATLIMLGAQDHIIATVAKPSIMPWMFRLVPSLSKAQPLEAGNLNGEELLRLDPDLVFVTASGHSADALSKVGLHVVPEGFDRFVGLLECVDGTATLLQTPLAAKRAQAYRVAFLKAVSQAATNPQGPKVLHVESLKPLRVDGDQSIIDQWILSAGGRNAAVGVHGNKQPVSMEQILTWNPDIIIIGANAGDPAQLASDGVWSQLAAVKAGRVYRNPSGIFPWDRYGPELLLQVDWARQIVQTGHVDEAEMITKMQDFYRQFYGIALRSEDAKRMLAALPPD
ncbi:ABC transporter ferrichrome transport [Gluconobacter thailandicus F149-1 = NBRC 100600]|uniref:Iron-chelating periplasmic-binding protein n=1 Tax=Gluconobacter thailandicus NBRC 3257 TaxID=1381097 RepID=A0ABQ0IU63_GLUTH|nr:ABC transporter substrate-binding protein [Gluconobacter thailandicus]KXV32387.1 iron ABC transporter substrate-binding protein [Gluconobacter thailandicus]KXV53151.1 iron ABC transporter substrate-binding protein [Gluconobacter thailandicus]GAC88070.1 iron-chelating periplasmic-binding protein [Gluconobacter thailandicus NBRC 3255]GAD25763.1 iron-chelating periplasmic-binding protein [Gluconobacter thailandicus NBRC 3257]GAN93954.1 ABC transporter ferrichrome transport [Gluconobacter thail